MNGVKHYSAISDDNGEQKSMWYDCEIASGFREATNESNPMDSARLKFLVALTSDSSHSAHVEPITPASVSNNPEELYQNSSASLGTVTSLKKINSSLELTSVGDVEDIRRKRRHSSSVEITAMTSVKTGDDGVPVISFSFLRKDEKPLSTPDNVDHLYDFPKNSREILAESATSNSKLDCQLYDFPTSNKVVSEPNLRTSATSEDLQGERLPIEELYDVPAKPERSTDDQNLKISVSLTLDNSDTLSPDLMDQSSYSDPEETCRSSSKSRKHKTLGRAWGRMRTWLRDEKLRLGEVVQRHAKMQAVGALRTHESTTCRGSYDLVEARARELGPITVIDEMGLSSVSEEANVSEVDTCDSVIRACQSEEKIELENGNGKTDDTRTRKLTPAAVSFSLDKLCDRGEEGGGEREGKHVGKGGLIRRRMLGSIRGLMASTHLLHQSDADETGPGGFEDIRRYVKQGGDFCKELAAVLHERAELEANYAKGLSKLSSKLTKACAKDQGGNSSGGVNEAWRHVGEEMEAAAEAHRLWGIALSEQLAKPLRVGVAEAQGRSRKLIESSVDKSSKSLQEWRTAAAKSKKQSFACARENERLQDLSRIHSLSQTQNNNKTATHMTEKEATKLENRRRKAEDGSRRADTEFYTVSVRAERARLEYESAIRKGANQMELLEEERLSALKDLANVYLSHLQALAPRLQQNADRLAGPVRACNVSTDVDVLKNLIHRMNNNEVSHVDQLLPDFYAEHVTLAMNRERRKQALVRVLHLIRQDLERERRGREGLETLHRAFIQTPAFAADESTQNVTDKLVHMRSMLTYLEAAKWKVGGALAEIEGGKRPKHALAEHILVSRDKQGLQQSVLKVPLWAKNESFEVEDLEIEGHEGWVDRTAGDGNSENPPDEEDFSDFDEFSSQSEDNNNQEDVGDLSDKMGMEQCRALYQYSANLNDELTLNPGDVITIQEKQADGWWIGECGGRTGIFPATYVQVLR